MTLQLLLSLGHRLLENSQIIVVLLKGISFQCVELLNILQEKVLIFAIAL